MKPTTSVRARKAHAAVTRRAAESGNWREYRAIALKLPVMVHNAGLVEALHFVAARKGPAQRLILDDLATDLERTSARELLAWLRGLEGPDLREQTREVLRRLAWYKRMVQALGTDGSLAGEGVA